MSVCPVGQPAQPLAHERVPTFDRAVLELLKSWQEAHVVREVARRRRKTCKPLERGAITSQIDRASAQIAHFRSAVDAAFQSDAEERAR